MSQGSLPSDWLTKFTDPYAVLGVSVAADDRRILKRYRNVAKILHPDSYVSSDEGAKQLASQLLARLVNPSYQKLKQDKGRAETVAMLRFQVRRLNKDTRFIPRTGIARKLLEHGSEADVFYEQAIADLAETQYQPLDQFESVTQQLGELNLIYLQLKMGDIFIREKRTGIVSAAEAKPMQFTPAPSDTETPPENYAHRHYKRAQEYMKKQSWAQAIQELRDAIKIEADKSEYHALLGLAYLAQDLKGMATVYFRQALKLNPQDPLALKYASKVGIVIESPAEQNKQPKRGGIFGIFGARKK
jgi:curved DNA-binding protein CbpA